MNVIRVLWCRIQQCFGMFTILLLEASSETGLLRDLFKHVLKVVISEIQKLWGWSFFSKYSKFNLDFKNAGKNWEKKCFFWDNCIWIGIIKLSLLRTRYFSSVANVSPRFGMSLREAFPNRNSLPVTNEDDKCLKFNLDFRNAAKNWEKFHLNWYR